MGVGFDDLTLEEAAAAGAALVEAGGFHYAVRLKEIFEREGI